MYYCESRLMYPVRVSKPDPLFAKLLQQALGGVEGELRVVFQYFFQAWSSRGPEKYKKMLLDTATEDLAHAELYATAIAMNLEGSSTALQEEMAANNPMVEAVMGGMSPRSYLSGGMGALAADSEGNPFNGSWVISSGNIAANMYANVEGEVGNQLVASRLHSLTDDPGMKDLLQFFITRDTMHSEQWLSVIEELGGGPGTLPIPNSFPQSDEDERFSYTYLTTGIDGASSNEIIGRFTSGPSLDGKGQYHVERAQPYGKEPKLAPPMEQAYAETQEMQGRGMSGILENIKDTLLG